MIGLDTAYQTEKAVGLVRRLFWHARIDVTFDPSQTFTRAGHTRHPGRTALYLHLLCQNLSWFVQASGCRAFLSQLWERTADTWTPLSGFSGPVPLRWANTPETGSYANQPAEVERRRSRRIDLGYVLDSEASLRLYLPDGFVGVVSILAPGDYLAQVEVRAANTFPLRCRRKFRLFTCNGTWSVQRAA